MHTLHEMCAQGTYLVSFALLKQMGHRRSSLSASSYSFLEMATAAESFWLPLVSVSS